MQKIRNIEYATSKAAETTEDFVGITIASKITSLKNNQEIYAIKQKQTK